MKRVVTSELLRNFALYGDIALSEPVVITRNGRERLVLLNVTEYNYLKQAAGLGEDLAAEIAPVKKQGRRLKKILG